MNERRWNSGQTGGRTRYAQFLSLSCLKIHFFITTQQCRGGFSPLHSQLSTSYLDTTSRCPHEGSIPLIISRAIRRDEEGCPSSSGLSIFDATDIPSSSCHVVFDVTRRDIPSLCRVLPGRTAWACNVRPSLFFSLFFSN